MLIQLIFITLYCGQYVYRVVLYEFIVSFSMESSPIVVHSGFLKSLYTVSLSPASDILYGVKIHKTDASYLHVKRMSLTGRY